MRAAGLVLAVAFAGAVAAADVSGKWTAQVPGRDGQTRETTFNFQVEGAKLTGTITTPRGEVPISDGKVEGDNISFTVTLNFGGNEIKFLYKGQVAGSEIKFTRERDGQTQQFTAKRAAT